MGIIYTALAIELGSGCTSTIYVGVFSSYQKAVDAICRYIARSSKNNWEPIVLQTGIDATDIYQEWSGRDVLSEYSYYNEKR